MSARRPRRQGAAGKAPRRSAKKAAAPRKTSAKKTARRAPARKNAVRAPSGRAPRVVATRPSPPPRPPGHLPWVFDVPFEWRAWASSQGIRWDAEHRAMVLWAPAIPAHLALFAAQPFSWEWHIQAGLQGKAPALSVAGTPWTPRPHQEVARDAIALSRRSGAPGFLLADDVGTGKTMSAWSFALASPDLVRVLIVTTASAVAHWRNTLLHAGIGRSSTLIINYDRLGKLFEEPEEGLSSSRAKGRRKRLAKQGVAPAYDLVIWDEAHKCKNPDAARSLMMRKIDAKAGFSLWLSATAGQTPLELSYLAPLLARVTHSSLSSLTGADNFEAWCKAQDIGIVSGDFGKLRWEPTPAQENRVRDWLFGGKPARGLRRLPTDIAGWPEMERSLMPQALDIEARLAFAKAWEEFRTTEMGLPAGRRSREANASALAARLRLRQKSSWLRVPATVAHVLDVRDTGRQVAVSVAFHDTLDEMARRLAAAGESVAVIHGKLSSADKEAERLRFQRGEARVVLFTVEEAISLHEGEHNDLPRTLLVHDLRWSALQQAQIEGRCHRDGRFAPTIWLYAPETIEEDIATVLVGRVKAMRAMHGDPQGDLAAIDAVLGRALTAQGA